MLNGHLDTVSLASYDGDGLTAEERDGNLYGRGAYDMKSGVGAIMMAAATAAAHPHAGDIVVALVADEEWGSAGTEEILRHVVTDTAVVVEPSGLDVVVAHRGFVWAEVTIHGTATHGSRPDLGVDAIVKAGRFLTAIGDLGRRLAASPRTPPSPSAACMPPRSVAVRKHPATQTDAPSSSNDGPYRERRRRRSRKSSARSSTRPPRQIQSSVTACSSRPHDRRSLHSLPHASKK